MALRVRSRKPRIGELRTEININSVGTVKTGQGGVTKTDTPDALGPFMSAVARANSKEVFEWDQRGSRVTHFVWVRASPDLIVLASGIITYAGRMGQTYRLQIQGRPEEVEERGFWLRIPCLELGAEST